MKKHFVILFFLWPAVLLLGEQIIITGPGQIFVGSDVQFRFEASVEAGASFRWDFGDGSSESKPGNENHHVYREPGSFRVTCKLENPPSGPVSGEIMVERPEFGNPTLTLGNEPGWMASLPASYFITKDWSVFVEIGYEASAIGESNPSPPDQNGSYILEPSSNTEQFWISTGVRFQL